MCVFLSDNAILVSHFSRQLLLGEEKEKKNKRKERKAGIDKKDREIYSSHRVEWELTGFLMLHAQNKKDSSLCSSPSA